MATLKNGFHLELVNRQNGQVLLSAATDEIDETVFNELWATVGTSIFKDIKKPNKIAQYEVRIVRFRADKP